MGQGGYIFCELDSIEKQVPEYQQVFAQLENDMILKCNSDWHRSFGFLTPDSGQYGRTTILPALFDGFDAAQMAHWRQTITSTGHQTLITGTRTGNAIPEDFKIAWIGLAFPNKTQHITEIKYQISDRKYGRIDLEEMMYGYECPAIIFEEGYVIDEETYFEMWGFIDLGYSGLQPENGPGGRDSYIYQNVVMLGSCYYKQIDRVLGDTGAAIT